MNNTPTPSKNEIAVRLYDEAQVFEGNRPSGLLIQGGDEILKLERELAAVTKERDRLAEALQKVVTSWDEATWLDDNEFESFREALAAVKGGSDE